MSRVRTLACDALTAWYTLRSGVPVSGHRYGEPTHHRFDIGDAPAWAYLYASVVADEAGVNPARALDVMEFESLACTRCGHLSHGWRLIG